MVRAKKMGELKRVKIFKILYLVCVLLLPSISNAQEDRAGLASQLKYVRGKIVQSENELVPLKKEEMEIRDQQTSLAQQVKDLLAEEGRIKDRLEAIVKSQESLNYQMTEVREQISKKKVTFENRVVHMYKTRRRLLPLSFLFSSVGGAEGFYKRSAYLRYLVKNDSNRLQEFTSLLEVLKSSREEFAKLGKEYDDQLIKGAATRKSFDAKQFELAKLVKVLDSKIAKISKRLESYNQQEEEYESLLKEITKSKVPEGNIISDLIKPRSLKFPVKGKIVQHFGKQKHGEFKDIVFVKGMEVSAENSEVVRVVLGGEVVFSSELPGFGSVLIVAHGSGIFSLYGRIVPIRNLGDRVNPDEIIAKTTSPDEQGRNFYFELRKDGKALNPEKYFLPSR